MIVEVEVRFLMAEGRVFRKLCQLTLINLKFVHDFNNHHSCNHQSSLKKIDFNALALVFSLQKKSPSAVTAEEDIPKTDYILIYLRPDGRDNVMEVCSVWSNS
jgi:hypothetical protein